MQFLLSGGALIFSWASKGGKDRFIKLDWAKAFDSLNPDITIQALR